jgi:hypothetical protein
MISTDDGYSIKSIDGETVEKYNISKVQQTLLLVIRKGIYTIPFESEPLTISGKLQDSFPYILTIQVSELNTLNKDSPLHQKNSRFLYQCPIGFYPVDGTYMRVCPTQYFKKNGFCWKCPQEKCTRCLSEKRCNPCKEHEFYFEEKGSCVKKCPEKYFEDFNNGICTSCVEGCKTCTFPNGQCHQSSFMSDMIINGIIFVVLVSFITLCACNCKRATEAIAKQNDQEQQEKKKEGPQDLGAKINAKLKVMKNQYNIMSESFDHDTEEGESEESERKNKKRLTEFAKSKLLTVSMSKKPFAVDDSNEERAVSHDSATKLHTKNSSASLFGSKAELSPALLAGLNILTTKEDSTPALPNGQDEYLSNKRLSVSMEKLSQESIEDGKHSISIFGLLAQKTSSFAKKGKKSDDSNDVEKAEFHFQSQEHEEEREEEHEREHEGEEDDEDEEDTRKEKEKNAGYNPDLSINNTSRDKDGKIDYTVCTICTLNKRNCLIQSCGHVVACYPCMEQWKKTHGVCPKCKRLISSLEKMSKKKEKK